MRRYSGSGGRRATDSLRLDLEPIVEGVARRRGEILMLFCLWWVCWTRESVKQV